MVTEDKKETPLDELIGLDLDLKTSIVTIKPSFLESKTFFAMAKTTYGHMIWKEIRITKKIMVKL